MNIFKKMAHLFSKKTTAEDQVQTTVQPDITIKENEGMSVKVADPPCSHNLSGVLAYPVFAPMPLLLWYSIQKAMDEKEPFCGNISMVTVIDLFNPQTSAFICTAFAIKDAKGWYWAKIGSPKVCFSGFDAFIYKQAQTFRISLTSDRSKKSYAAICTYTKGAILVTGLIEQTKTPPTDDDREPLVECDILPCLLAEACEFVKKL